MATDVGEKTYLSHTSQELDDGLDAIPLKALQADLAAEVTAREKLQAAVMSIINSGAKNRLKLTAVSFSRTHNGITFTVGDDGTVTASGTATANAYIQVAAVPGDSELFDGSYRLCGCPTGGSRETYAQYMALSNYARYDYGESVGLIPTGLTGNVGLVIMVYAGATVENVVFKPMICKASDYLISPEYVPYCPTMAELYQMILDLGGGNRSMSSTSAQIMSGAEGVETA